MFDAFDSLMVGRELEFDGKKYMQLKMLPGGLLMAVEIGATMPANVVIIKDPKYKDVESLEER